MLNLRHPWVRPLVAAASLAVVGAVVLGSYACGTGDTTSITPITGIVVRSSSIIAGHGCGEGPGEIYKYTVAVTSSGEGGAKQEFLAGGTFDCFADATFVNLCASTSGSTAYNVGVYAFTQAAWTAKGAGLIDLASLSSYCYYDGGSSTDPLQNLNYVQDYATYAPFQTSCVATQQSNIEVVAVCHALTAVPTSPQ